LQIGIQIAGPNSAVSAF